MWKVMRESCWQNCETLYKGEGFFLSFWFYTSLFPVAKKTLTSQYSQVSNLTIFYMNSSLVQPRVTEHSEALQALPWLPNSWIHQAHLAQLHCTCYNTWQAGHLHQLLVQQSPVGWLYSETVLLPRLSSLLSVLTRLFCTSWSYRHGSTTLRRYFTAFVQHYLHLGICASLR